VIEEEKRPLSPIEIWEIGKLKVYANELNTTGKTPWNSISARIYVDLRDNPDSIFNKVKSKPAKFYLKKLPLDDSLLK